MRVLEPNREGYRVCRVRDAACHQMVSRAIVTRRNGAVVSLDDVLRSDNRASNGRCGGSGCHERRAGTAANARLPARNDLTEAPLIAKLSPWTLAPSSSRILDVLIPMTSPRKLSSGPPEFPGLIAASVWIKSTHLPVREAEYSPFVMVGPPGRSSA